MKAVNSWEGQADKCPFFLGKRMQMHPLSWGWEVNGLAPAPGRSGLSWAELGRAGQGWAGLGWLCPDQLWSS